MTRPTITCLCGSTRFRREYEEAFRREEHAGRICLTVPCYKDDPCCKAAKDHARLDELHRHKIDLADEVLVIDVLVPRCPHCHAWYALSGGGNIAPFYYRACDCPTGVPATELMPVETAPYVSELTRREIEYAERAGKPVRYLSREQEEG